VLREKVERERFRKLSRVDQREEILHWFHSNYEDPVEIGPYESAEGGYQYIWGGPCDAREEIESNYGGIAPQKLIDKIVDELNDISFEWSGVPSDDDLNENNGDL